MSKIYALLFLALGISSPSAHALQGDIQRARFNIPLQALARAFPPGRQDPRQVAERALDAGARSAAFNLQGLTKIYKDLDARFKELGDAAKDLEDAIGEVDKWTKVLAAATRPGVNTPLRELTRIRTNQTNAKAEYAQLLVDVQWVRADGGKTFVQKSQEMINTFRWPTDREDRNFIINGVDKQVQKVRNTEFDMSILENGDGLHELRRELRWIMIEAQALGGVIAFRPGTACPSQEFTGDIEARVRAIDPSGVRFLSLPEPSTVVTPCLISRCLFQGTALLVTQLGSIKDQVEQLLNRTGGGDTVPPQFRRQAEDAQKLLLKSNLLPLLDGQLRQCRN